MDKVDNVLMEYTVMNIIKKRPDFSHAINQDRITEEINETAEQDDFISSRSVRRIIEGLIEEGYPIISTPIEPGGYCFEGADGEALECYKRLRRKGLKILKRARCVLRNKYKGQLNLFEIKKKIGNYGN